MSNSYSSHDQLAETVPGVSPPEDAPKEETSDPQMPQMTCTLNQTKARAHREVAGGEYAEGTVYGKTTGLYNKHHGDSERFNPLHPFHSTHNNQLSRSCFM